MSKSTTTPGINSRGYPVVTRREAHELVHASKALWEVVDRAQRDMYGMDARQARNASIVAERASVARGAITALLIAAKVHADSEQADAALERI